MKELETDAMRALKLEIKELEDKLHDKRVELHSLEVAALPWKVGDVVRVTANGYSRKPGELLKIVGVYNARLGWPQAVAQKKDGSWSKRTTTLYRDFEVVT